jgi:transposase-like protein
MNGAVPARLSLTRGRYVTLITQIVLFAAIAISAGGWQDSDRDQHSEWRDHQSGGGHDRGDDGFRGWRDQNGWLHGNSEDPNWRGTVYCWPNRVWIWLYYTLHPHPKHIGLWHKGVYAMAKSIFSAPHFNDEAAAYAYVEARAWTDGRICPHCGVIDRSAPLKGKSSRIGLYKCYACREPFTVKVGTMFESSHIQLRDWLTAIHLICSSKKGISANQLHRTLGITLRSAWFMGHRIREAFRSDSLAPMGGAGSVFEVDETFIGNKADMPKHRGYSTQSYPL